VAVSRKSGLQHKEKQVFSSPENPTNATSENTPQAAPATVPA